MPPRRKLIRDEADGRRSRSKSAGGCPEPGPSIAPAGSKRTAQVYEFALDSPTKPVKPKHRRLSELTPQKSAPRTKQLNASEALEQLDELPSDVSESDLETDGEINLEQSSDSEHSDLQPLDDEDEQEIDFQELQEKRGLEESSASGSESDDDEVVLDTEAASRRHLRRRSPSPAGGIILQSQPASDDDDPDDPEVEPAPKGDPIPQCSEEGFVASWQRVFRGLSKEQKVVEKMWTSSADDKPPKIQTFDSASVGLKGDVPTNVREAFRLMFSEDIFETMVRHTNTFAQQYQTSSTVTNAKKEHSKCFYLYNSSSSKQVPKTVAIYRSTSLFTSRQFSTVSKIPKTVAFIYKSSQFSTAPKIPKTVAFTYKSSQFSRVPKIPKTVAFLYKSSQFSTVPKIPKTVAYIYKSSQF